MLPIRNYFESIVSTISFNTYVDPGVNNLYSIVLPILLLVLAFVLAHSLTVLQSLPSAALGFTLIELLVVIAVIGILAAVVLIAINPLEQVKRAQDADLKQKINTLGNAAQGYLTTTAGIGANATTYPPDQATLVVSGDIKVNVKDNANVDLPYCANNNGTSTCSVTCTTSSPCQYMIVYHLIASQLNVSGAKPIPQSGGPTCTVSNTYFLYSVNPGTTPKAGLYCKASVPVSGDSFY